MAFSVELRAELLEDKKFADFNAIIKELTTLDLFELLEYQIVYGEFATECLVASRMEAKFKLHDPFLEGIKEMTQDKEFIDNLPFAMQQKVHLAVAHAKYDS